MPRKVETINRYRDVPSTNAASLVLSGLEEAARRLQSSKVKSLKKGCKTVFHAQERLLDFKHDGRTREEQQAEAFEARGYVRDAWIRQSKAGKITLAALKQVLPAKFSDETFPKPPVPYASDFRDVRIEVNAQSEELGPRVVIDSWTTPATKLTAMLLEEPRDMDAYDLLNRNLFRSRNSDGIPLAATHVSHMVLGRPNEIVNLSERIAIANILDAFSVAVTSEIAFVEGYLK